MIYLASPYSDPDPTIRQARYEEAVRYAARLWAEGKIVFSPIAHSHPIALHGIDGQWKQWQEFDCTIIRACSEMWILMLPGWEQSRGIAAETAYAATIGLPIAYVQWTNNER